jgi:hypothetical protein
MRPPTANAAAETERMTEDAAIHYRRIFICRKYYL